MHAVLRLPSAVKTALVLASAVALVLAARSAAPQPPIKHAAITGIGGGYFAIAPTRVLDTRASNQRLSAGKYLNVALPTQTVPSGAGAVVLNVTAINPDGPGYLSVLPGNQSPAAPGSSNLNFSGGVVIPNLVIVQLPLNGSINLYANTGVDVVIDVAGYFSPASGTTSGASGP